MKFLFVAPRFHTNQFSIVKSIIEAGHQVKFFVQYIGKSEDHSIIKPLKIKKSLFSSLIYKLIEYKYSANDSEKMKVKFFLPAVIHLFKEIREYRPDIVILRDKNFLSLYVYFICRILKIKCTLLYNQTPLYTRINRNSNHIKNIMKNLYTKYGFPAVRITTVCIRDVSEYRKNPDHFYVKDHEYFVPFIVETNEETAYRRYCKDEKVNILSVGKYREYKNHFLLIDAISLINNRSNLKVTIIGQVANGEEQNYFNSLKAYITKKKLDNIVNLEKNMEYKKMHQIYQNNDIFVLASKEEYASISILEAMANGMVTISTDVNGTASYIKEGKCGYLFRTMNAQDLAAKIEEIISYNSLIKKMGKNAFLNVRDNYCFDNYCIEIGKVLKREFGIDFYIGTRQEVYKVLIKPDFQADFENRFKSK